MQFHQTKIENINILIVSIDFKSIIPKMKSSIALIIICIAVVHACDKALCGVTVAKCALICACDFPECECCPECFECMGPLVEACCDCVDLCPSKSNVTQSIVSIGIVKTFNSQNVNTTVIPVSIPNMKVVSITKDGICFQKQGIANVVSNMTSSVCSSCTLCVDTCAYYHWSYWCCDGPYCCCYNAPGPCNRNVYCQSTMC